MKKYGRRGNPSRALKEIPNWGAKNGKHIKKDFDMSIASVTLILDSTGFPLLLHGMHDKDFELQIFALAGAGASIEKECQ